MPLPKRNYLKRNTHKTPFGYLIVYCRNIKEAKKAYERLFKKPFNRNNKERTKINEQGHLILTDLDRLSHPTQFSIENIWLTCGYYPILQENRFYNLKLYDKLIPCSIRLIRSLASGNV